MSTPVAESPAGEALLGDEKTWSGRIFSDGWVDAPETIESTEPATGDVLEQPARGTPRPSRRRPSPRRARSASGPSPPSPSARPWCAAPPT